MGTTRLFSGFKKSDDMNETYPPWESDWVGYPTSFYLTGLTEGTYFMQAWIKLSDSSTFVDGEPFAEQNVTLTEGQEVYGVNLIPQDDLPKIYFEDPPNDYGEYGIYVTNGNYNGDPAILNGFGHLEQNITVDSNTTNLETLSEFEWGIRGYDPAHGTIST